MRHINTSLFTEKIYIYIKLCDQKQISVIFTRIVLYLNSNVDHQEVQFISMCSHSVQLQGGACGGLNKSKVII